MNAQTESLSRPYIAIAPYIRPHTNILYLRIKNIGRTAAQNVRLRLDRDFFQFANSGNYKKNLRNLAAFANAIDSMPPEFELHFALAQGPHLYGPNVNFEVTPIQFAVTAEYEFQSKRVSEVTRIDLRPYLESEGSRDPVVEELERIRREIAKS